MIKTALAQWYIMFARRVFLPMFSRLAGSWAKGLIRRGAKGTYAGLKGIANKVIGSQKKARMINKRRLQAKKNLEANMLSSIYEKKYFDAGNGDSTDCTTAGVYNYQSICKVPQGTAANNRVGRKILIDKINLRCIVNWPGQTDLAKMTGIVRLMLVWDKQPNGAVPTVGTHLTANGVTDYNNLLYADRFTVLMDERIEFNQSNAVLTGPTYSSASQEYFREYYIDCHIPIHYSSTTGALTELISGNIFLYSVCDTNVTAVVDADARIRFHDL